MAPFLANLMSRSFDASQAEQEFSAQWIRPGDVFSILLILGGDVIARAMAQVAGSGPATVAFSFGWVAYSVSALVSAVGDNRLLSLDPDCKCKVIHGKSGYAKDNSSWIIGRIVRDYPYWMHSDVKTKWEEILTSKHEELKRKDPNAARPPMAGLVVSVYEPSEAIKARKVKRDLVYWIGIPVTVFQLGIAAIPCGVFGDWGILLITACGIALSILTGLLPQWAKEKWACRSNSKHSVVLTRGNGAQHAIVIRGNGHGLNFEDLASGQSNTIVVTESWTRIALLTLAALWILLLITAAGQKTNTWFLLAVGGAGILQNVYVAGAQRRPENFGVPLEYVEVFGNSSVMDTLLQVEERYKAAGRAMLGEFFPGELRDEEKVKWADLKKAQADLKKEEEAELKKKKEEEEAENAPTKKGP